ncbi:MULTISPECIES: NADH-quinone oxidoreductase subunit J [unclassified Bartonella]|uniref:NADH-quinone oxidoreductase subunit J n=1 Tax=unclassified Bartonella TaxID=2645622 RepID=UPI00099A34B3|nr:MULTISPECIES: NADH-quinone oxidoreductase subunit J [unclassified Bartonella]AQX27982.1 NADH dehydrogenase subunit J [Bartonella sp. JB15]AQX29259.1 NADH dehydrogenase subunit J [Bartonella sp. JB63]
MLTGLAVAFFYIFAFIMLISAVIVISARNPVHSVLFLILAFFNAAALFLLAGAEFLGLILLIVYVGAVAVLFLFVVMMLDIDFTEFKSGALKYAPIGAFIGIIIAIELIFVFINNRFSLVSGIHVTQPTPELTQRTNTQALGDILYTDYVFYFQISGVILLVAMIGAIILTLRHRSSIKRQSVAVQVARTVENAIEIKKVKSGKGI